MKPLQGKVALVTGATRGIGKAIALELAAHGATLVGTATTSEGADTISRYLGAAGTGIALDVTDDAQIQSVLEDVTSRFGDVGILVNNAGITRDNLLVRMKEAEWDLVMATNLRPLYSMSKLVLRAMMKARYGRIINITSVVGVTGNAGQANYAAAKSGIMGFSKSLAREVGSRNITVNCVAPGFIDTDMTRNLNELQRTALIGQIPLGRLGKPEDVAAMVCFLASPGADYVTGSTFHVNGGMYMD